jgi:NitT/TauT family transport system permease protein
MARGTPALAGVGAFTDDADAQASFVAAKRHAARRKQLLPVLAFALILVAWEATVRIFDIPAFIAPTPSAVAALVVAKFGLLMTNLLPTAIETFLGFTLGNGIAIAIAILFVYQRTAEEALYPIAVMINTIPIIAIAPILVLLMGNGIATKVAIAAIICFFPTLVNMTRGLRAVSPQQLELMRVLSATPREVLFKVRLKNALPYLFAALKIAASTAVIGAIVGEWIGTTLGIGALIIQATYNFDSTLLYATIFVGAAFSAAFFGAIAAIERRVLRWSVEHRD